MPAMPYFAKRSKQPVAIAIVFVGVLVAALGFFAIKLPQASPKASAVPALSATPAATNISLDWPAVGEAAVGTTETGMLASSSNSEQSRPTASMAKIIAALAIMEKQPFQLGEPGQIYSISARDIENMSAYAAQSGSVQPMLIGMKITQYQAMQRMLIASDNSMADMLVERIFGSPSEYVSYANTMAKRLGLQHTVVADASGFDPATVSTPSEMVSLGIAALKNPVIADIVSQSSVRLPVVGIIKNTNELLGVDGVIGIKTGTTDEAGSCLLFAAKYPHGTLVGVIMGDTDHASLYSDARHLLASAKRQLF